MAEREVRGALEAARREPGRGLPPHTAASGANEHTKGAMVSEQASRRPAQSEETPPLFRVLAATRYVFVLAIFSTYAATVILLVLGTLEMLHTVVALIGLGDALTTNQARLHLIEAVDLFLMATVLYVISAGLYQLFVNTRLPLPAWLQVRSAGDMEAQLIGVLITILGVYGLELVTSWEGGTDVLAVGVVVALLIFSLGYFAVHHGRAHHSSAHRDEEEHH
jgi:uncharacterized membrane protein YqhA